MPRSAFGRVESLDLIRGIAVLGILAINIAGFAGPPLAILTPNWAGPASLADEMAFAASFVLFEGKMRALFTLLFGASLVLFDERAEARGQFGDLLQLRRLSWLALFGLAHFYLLWWGDILFFYAACGLLALLARELPIRTLVVSALAIFLVWHGAGAAYGWPDIRAEEAVRIGVATPDQARGHAERVEALEANARTDLAVVREGFVERAATRLGPDFLRPFTGLFYALGETLPLMLLGMALYRSGFFTGGWSRAALLRLAWLGTGAGLALTLASLGWLWPRGFPPVAMQETFLTLAAVPHLLMATGFAACLVLAAPRLAATWIGKRLVAAGRMAFSNYIGTSLLMTALFYGWGLGLAGTLGHAALWLFVLLGWAVMLAWSAPWLERFGRGPLETLWRLLVHKGLRKGDD